MQQRGEDEGPEKIRDSERKVEASLKLSLLRERKSYLKRQKDIKTRRFLLSDISSDQGSQLPHQEFYLLPGSYLIGHFPVSLIPRLIPAGSC